MSRFEVMKEWLIKQAENKSVRQLGRELGIHHTTLHRILNGEINDIKQSTLEKFEAVMGIGNDNFTFVKANEFIAITVNNEEHSLGLKTNIKSKEQAMRLIAVALGRMALDEGFTDNQMVGLVMSVYEAMKENQVS